jgi:transposase-like protein
MSMSSGRRRRRLTPEEKWEVFVEVTSLQLTQRDAARKWGVDVSVIIKLRKLAKDAALGRVRRVQTGSRRVAAGRADRGVAGRQCPVVRGAQGVGRRADAGAGNTGSPVEVVGR